MELAGSMLEVIGGGLAGSALESVGGRASEFAGDTGAYAEDTMGIAGVEAMSAKSGNSTLIGKANDGLRLTVRVLN